MKIMPIRYITDMESSLRFFQAIGLEADSGSHPASWAELNGRSGILALHAAPAEYAGQCELAFVTDEPLEGVVDRLVSAGFQPDAIVDQPFGRSFRVRDPEGVWVQVNEHAAT